MARIPLRDDLKAKLRVFRVPPLALADQHIPDEWLALLDHLHGQAAQTDRDRQIDRS